MFDIERGAISEMNCSSSFLLPVGSFWVEGMAINARISSAISVQDLTPSINLGRASSNS
jgi:hypothetical protein